MITTLMLLLVSLLFPGPLATAAGAKASDAQLADRDELQVQEANEPIPLHEAPFRITKSRAILGALTVLAIAAVTIFMRGAFKAPGPKLSFAEEEPAQVSCQ